MRHFRNFIVVCFVWSLGNWAHSAFAKGNKTVTQGGSLADFSGCRFEGVVFDSIKWPFTLIESFEPFYGGLTSRIFSLFSYCQYKFSSVINLSWKLSERSHDLFSGLSPPKLAVS